MILCCLAAAYHGARAMSGQNSVRLAIFRQCHKLLLLHKKRARCRTLYFFSLSDLADELGIRYAKGMSPSTANPTLFHRVGWEKWPHPQARPVHQGEQQDQDQWLAGILSHAKLNKAFRQMRARECTVKPAVRACGSSASPAGFPLWSEPRSENRGMKTPVRPRGSSAPRGSPDRRLYWPRHRAIANHVRGSGRGS